MTQEEGGQGMCGAREAWIDGEWDWGEWTRSRGGARLSGSFCNWLGLIVAIC